jgi:hypothetical protein
MDNDNTVNETLEALKKEIFDSAKEGYLVLKTPFGFCKVPINEFIKQSVDGILYDLNRLPEVVSTFLDDPKWVNDYAVALTIKALREKVDELEQKIKELENPHA